MYFFDILLLFFIEKIVFLSLSLLFFRSIKFPQQNINESGIRIGDKKLSVALHVIWNNIDSISDFLVIKESPRNIDTLQSFTVRLPG